MRTLLAVVTLAAASFPTTTAVAAATGDILSAILIQLVLGVSLAAGLASAGGAAAGPARR